MIKRISALNQFYQKGIFGKSNKTGLILSEIKDLTLYQVAAWPETLNDVGVTIAKACNLEDFPSANKAISGSKVAMLRIEPLKWWIIGSKIKDLLPEMGSVIDLSHSRIHIRISGNNTISLLGIFL